MRTSALATVVYVIYYLKSRHQETLGYVIPDPITGLIEGENEEVSKMSRRERYVIEPTDECAKERINLRMGLVQLREQTQQEMERIDIQFWENWKKSHNPDEWSGLGKDPVLAVVMAKTWYGVGPDLSGYKEKIRQYEEMLRQTEHMSCKEVRKMICKLGITETPNDVTYTPGDDPSGPPPMPVEEIDAITSAPPEIDTSDFEEWLEQQGESMPSDTPIGEVGLESQAGVPIEASIPPDIDLSDFEEWLDQHDAGSGPPDIDSPDEMPEPSPAPAPTPPSQTPEAYNFTFAHEIGRGKYESREPHWPRGKSGVTIGPGYDMKERSAEQIIDELTAAGVDKKTAEILSKAAGKKNREADEWADSHKHVRITTQQERTLFNDVLVPIYERRAKTYVDKRFGAGTWGSLDQDQKAMLFDMAYNPGLSVFPRFTKAVINRSWATAAQEYVRGGVGRRNDDFRDAFIKPRLEDT